MTFWSAGLLSLVAVGVHSGDARDAAQRTPASQSRSASDPSARDATTAVAALEDEVVANLKAQKIGSATAADLGFPDEYWRRVAGRVLRSSFEENFRIVVTDEPPSDGSGDASGDPASKRSSEEPRSSSSSPAQHRSMGSGTAPASEDGSSLPFWLILAAFVGCGVIVVLLAARRAQRSGASDR
jgi:hypothetical protein